MRIREVLIKALTEVDAADLSPELRPIAFRATLEALLRGSAVPVEHGGAEKHPHVDANAPARGELETLAHKLKVQPEVVGEVYHLSEGKLEIIVGAGKISSSSSAATRELALLVVGGRQLAGLEEWTNLNEIREVAENFGKYDSPNFARCISQMDSVFSFRGKGRQREVKLNRVGLEELQKHVNKLTGN